MMICLEMMPQIQGLCTQETYSLLEKTYNKSIYNIDEDPECNRWRKEAKYDPDKVYGKTTIIRTLHMAPNTCLLNETMKTRGKM